jgi:esterase/lipase
MFSLSQNEKKYIKQPSQEVNEKLDNKTERFWKETLKIQVKLSSKKLDNNIQKIKYFTLTFFSSRLELISLTIATEFCPASKSTATLSPKIQFLSCLTKTLIGVVNARNTKM